MLKENQKFPKLILLTILTMYLSVGTIISFLQGGIAPILLSQGLELSAMSWVFLIYLPLGLAFFWSPLVDRYRLFKMGYRSGWMIIGQMSACITISIIAILKPQDEYWLYLIILGLLVTICMATVDLALDAFTSEQVKDQERSGAGAVKVAGFTLGSLLGGGILVAWYPKLGWTNTLLIIMLINLLAWFLCVGLNKYEKQSINNQKPTNKRAGILNALKNKMHRMRLIYVCLFMCTVFSLFGLNRLLMVNMGMSLEKIGGIFGILMPLCNLLLCFLLPLLLKRFNTIILFRYFVILVIASAILVSLGYVQNNTSVVIAGSLLISVANTAFFIIIASQALKWAKDGEQTATNYALIYGGSRLSATVLAVFLPMIIQTLGWLYFQIGAVFFFLLTATLLISLLNSEKKIV